MTRPRSILHRLRVESPSSSSTAGPQSRHEHSEAMSISVASCTIKENRLQLRRGLNRCSKRVRACLPRAYFGGDTGRAKAFGITSIVADATSSGCRQRLLRSALAVQIRQSSRLVWQGRPSSNDRERAPIMSPVPPATNASASASGACAIGESLRSHFFQCRFSHWFFAFSICSGGLWLRTTPFR